MKSEIELKPCPCCGGKAEFSRFVNPRNFFCVQCSNCGIKTDGFLTNLDGTDIENKTIQAAIWNRRVDE